MINEQAFADISLVTPGKLKRVRNFWLGFVIYTAAYTISKAVPGYINQWYLLQIGGLVLLVPAAVKLIRFRFENVYLKTIFILYCCWIVYIIVRGIPFNLNEILYFTFDAWNSVFLYLVPFILLFPPQVSYLKRVFDVICILCILYIGYSLVFRGVLLNPDGDDLTSQGVVEFFSKTLSLPGGFLLLTYIYHSNKRKLLAAFAIMLTLVLAAIRARRGLIFMTMSRLVFCYFIFFLVNKRRLSIVILSAGLLAGLVLYGIKVYSENKRGLFSLITERLDEDTRSGVEDCYYSDMKTKDWIIGRGIKGEYYCPGVDMEYANYRTMIETDYLNIILKGGVISLGLLFLMAVPAMIKGLFFSKNILSKAAGIWILLWLSDLYPATINTFTLNYLLVWISVGICYSKTIRNMSDSAIKEIFSN